MLRSSWERETMSCSYHCPLQGLLGSPLCPPGSHLTVCPYARLEFPLCMCVSLSVNLSTYLSHRLSVGLSVSMFCGPILILTLMPMCPSVSLPVHLPGNPPSSFSHLCLSACPHKYALLPPLCKNGGHRISGGEDDGTRKNGGRELSIDPP